MSIAKFALAAIAFFSTIFPSIAEPSRVPCGERTAIMSHLEDGYSEEPVAMGIDAQGRVLEVLAAPDGKTWTILVSSPGGLTCLIASGVAWERLRIKIGDGI